MYMYKKREKSSTTITSRDVQKEDVYLPDFCYHDLTYLNGFIFTLPKSNHLQNLLTPKDNLLKETAPKTINFFSKNIFKLPQETLIKTAIDN